MLKIGPSEIKSFFYNNFFNFGGRNVPGLPPGSATGILGAFLLYSWNLQGIHMKFLVFGFIPFWEIENLKIYINDR